MIGLGTLWKNTLRDLLATRPARRGTTSPRTLAEYDTAIALWVQLTGDPPITEITPHTVNNFLRLLIAQNGRSMATLNKYCRHLNALFALCGPTSFRHPDRLGLVQDTPWVKPPRMPRCPAKPAYTPTQLATLIAACFNIQPDSLPASYATRPILIGRWWAAIILFTYNTGLRREAILAFRRSYIIADTWAIIPAQDSKTATPYRIYLNAAARDIITALPTGDILFPFNASPTTLDRQRRAIAAYAGVPDYGLHGIRRTLATELKHLPGGETVARIMLGHAPLDVSDRHYADYEQLIPAVMEKLPQPLRWRPTHDTTRDGTTQPRQTLDELNPSGV